MKLSRYLLVLIVSIAFFLSWSCSTQKNTFVNRNFHSITTKYNGYFNARESYRDGLYRLDQVHEDNYEDVLSIFRYGSQQQRSVVAGNMETAYQKASTAIRRHSMNIRGVEYNRWIDDSYYLIARSHFFKGDYNLAILTFQYVIRQFDTPLKYKSKIWVAKTHIENDNFTNAQQILERVSRNIDEGLLDERAIFLYHLVYADYYLRQREFRQASIYLDNAIPLASGRKMRTRLTFILAQAYHQDDNYAMAQQTYAQVLRLSPDFQMAFQARINMAMAYDVGSGDGRQIHDQLTSMLRDNKNREFRDQIYYALGQFSMRRNREEQAIEYFNQSLENFRGNTSQRGITFLRLAEISFQNREYLQSAALYDSTMVYLSNEYPEFEKAGRTNIILKELAFNMRRIEREDSLQRLAAMGTAERNIVLDEIIERIAEEERLEREREQERALMRQQMARAGRGQAAGAGGGGWYFYNPAAITQGRNEFYAKWGERDLEDLWRISNKRTMAFGDMGDYDLEDEGQAPSGRVTRASLMENVPTTPEKLAVSNDRLAVAHFNVANIFKDRLHDIDNAMQYYTALIERFPENENRLISAYFMHVMHNQQNNTPQANRYKNLIIDQYPDTDFARILSDPNYRENIERRQDRVNQIYANAYGAFLAGNYNLALDFLDQGQADTLEISREKAARFSFLKALIFARTDRTDDLIGQLTYVTEAYVETEVHQPATHLLALLGSDGLAMTTETVERSVDRADERGGERSGSDRGTPLDSSIFNYNASAVHFYVLIVNTQQLQIRQLRNDINAFNRENYAENNLNMSTLFFDQNRQLITVTNFPDADQALKYGQMVAEHVAQSGHSQDAYMGFAISVDNYPLFYQDRKLDEYIAFFRTAYSNTQ